MFLRVVFLGINISLAARQQNGSTRGNDPGSFFRRTLQRNNYWLAPSEFHRPKIWRQGASAVFQIVRTGLRYGNSCLHYIIPSVHSGFGSPFLPTITVLVRS